LAKKKCSICAHGQAGEINAALEAGLFQRDVAAQFSVSKFAVSRHKAKCLAPALPDAPLSDTDEITKWMQRCDDSYLAASANGDVARQVAALSAAFRGIQQIDKQREKDAAETARNNPDSTVTIAALDSAVRTYLTNLPPGVCEHCGAPTENGRFVMTEVA
jgi:hypothetical protein